MLKKNLETQFSLAFEACGIPLAEPVFLEDPRHAEHGDYACNSCFKLAREFRKAPKMIAEEIAEKLKQSSLKEWGIITPLNGFLNIALHNHIHWATFTEVKPNAFPEDKNKYLVEYVSANPTGPLHIGHGRWAVLGSSIVNMMKFTGKTVSSEFYVNDAGNQINKFIDSVNAVKNGTPIPEDGYHGSYIKDIAKSDKNPIVSMKEQQAAILSKVGATFDLWFSEKSLHDNGELESTLADLKARNYIYEKDGATWFKSEALGDDKDRVLIKADGAYAYFAADIAYHKNKLDRGFNRLINIFGADHHGYVGRIKASVAALKGDDYKPESIQILIGQLVNLFRDGTPVKMSKRSGEMITLDEVADEIGVDATRFFLILKSADTHIDFDLELAKKTSSENPIYYIQYAHARICSILEKCKDIATSETIEIITLEEKEKQLISHINRFRDDIYNATEALLPHKLANYTYDLARHFHHFYEACPILKADDTDKIKRIIILEKTKSTFKTCLDILGISAPESM